MPASKDNIYNKLVRDTYNTRGNNQLNPYKNRGIRYNWPVVILDPENKPPKNWQKRNISLIKEDGKYRLDTVESGFGSYVLVSSWQRKKEELINKGVTATGSFKVGIPYEEAATLEECNRVLLTLTYQTHRILGTDDEIIERKWPLLFSAITDFAIKLEPICPLCKEQLEEDDFVPTAEDPSDIFFKESEGKDNAIQLFHIKPLKPGKFLHEHENISWGHRRCNVTAQYHTIDETLEWFKEILHKHRY